MGTQHGTNSWPRSPTGDSSLHLPCHKTHFLLVLGITRCDAGTKDNTDSGDEEPVICFDASIQPTKMRQHLDTRGAYNRQDTLIYKMSGLIFRSQKYSHTSHFVTGNTLYKPEPLILWVVFVHLEIQPQQLDRMATCVD